MNKKIIIGSGIAVVIAVIIGISINETNQTRIPEHYATLPPNPQTLGPLTINKDKYLIGENVFISMEIHPLENGEVTFYSPKDVIFFNFGFNGSYDPSPNVYFRPMLSGVLGVCSTDDIAGTWKAVIEGVTLTNNKQGLTTETKILEFEFLDEIIRGDTRFDEDKC